MAVAFMEKSRERDTLEEALQNFRNGRPIIICFCYTATVVLAMTIIHFSDVSKYH